MSYPLFKFTLDNTSSGSLNATDYTSGWKELSFSLERDKEFHSLIELAETPLIFRATAKEYIVDIVDNQGPDSQCSITIDLSYDEGTTYDTVFTGLLRLELIEEVYEGSVTKEVKVPIIQNDFWQKFMNRKDTTVQIGSTTDLDGNSREAISTHTLNLPSQAVRKRTLLKLDDDSRADLNYGSDQTNLTTYSILDFAIEEKNEIEEKYNYPQQIVTTLPEDDKKFRFLFTEAGTYDVTVRTDIVVRFATAGINNVLDWSIEWFVVHQQIDGTRTEYSVGSDSGTSGSTIEIINFDEILLNQIITVSAGDTLYTYGELFAEKVRDIRVVGATNNISRVDITADTIIPDSSVQTYKIHEAGNSISNLIVGQNDSFYSEFLGNTSTTNASYAGNGDGSYKALTQGINIRGKLLTEKPMFMSFMDWWNGINPICNLGLGYETISSIERIRVEEKEHFYNDNPSLTLSNIEDLIRYQEDDLYTKAIEIGFAKWKSESLGALDDPQTKHDYATRFKTFGKDQKLLSNFYAAGIGIEATRRKSLQETEDWKLDDDIMIIELDSASQSNPDLFAASPANVTNVNNFDTRYNLKLTPKRSLLRWGNWLSIGLNTYSGALFRFVGAEGNYDMTSTIINSERGDYNNVSIAEDDDLAWDYGASPFKDEQKPILLPLRYEFSCPLTKNQWDTLVANRKRSIEISASSTGHFSVFINKVTWKPSNGMAQFIVHKAY